MKKSLLVVFLAILSLVATSAQGQSYPVTDAFSGSGALSSNWTNTTETTDFPGTLVQSSGKAVPSPSGTIGFATYTGATFTADQYAQAVVTQDISGGNDNTGPCVRTDATGNGYCYIAQNGQVQVLTAGAPVVNGIPATIIIHWQVCPVGAIGDTVKITAVGSTITCTDITKGTSASVTDTTLTSGKPGIIVDQFTNMGAPDTNYALKSFQADCIPTCVSSPYPVTDSFSGSGALSANWTNTLAGAGMSYPFVQLVRSSGTVVPNKVALTSTSYGLATYTGAAFTFDQYAQVKFVAHTASGNETGPCVAMSTAGTGFCYFADSGDVVALYYGVYSGSAPISCPIPASGDTIRLSLVGSTFTCADVTAGTSASGPGVSGFYIAGGNPGLLVDQRSSASYALTSFQADCIPTCVVPATPTFSPGSGSYGSTQTVTISDATPSSTIYYTTNGTTPTTSSPVYSAPITVSYTDTVEAIATAPGTVISAVGSATFILQVATPTFSPGAGSYNSSQTVTISTASPGATIYYTTNGTTPTTGSSVYTAPITVSASETVKALAVASGSPNSSVGSAAYVLQVATPTLSPAAGAYLATQTVTISDATPSSTIYYTTNSTTPTTGSAVYSGPITVSSSKTVKAIATVTSGYTNSLVASSLYTIGKTLSAVGISPQGTALQAGSSQQFSVTCTYSDSSTDDCTEAGGATWRTSALNQVNSSVTSAGLVTWHTDPGAGNAPANFVIVTASGISDKAAVYGQHPGDTWYQYPTPHAVSPSNKVVVGSTVTVGSAFSVNDASMSHTGSPYQASCNWSSSDPTIATVDRNGQVTAVASGSVTITCGRTGDAAFGSSTLSGWVSPGTTVPLTVVAGGTSNTTWYVLPGGGTIYSTTNTAGQCSGKVNQTYAAAGGTGVNQACGAGNIRYLWDDGVTYYSGSWVIQGGDTVIVAQNSAGYNTGLDGPGGSPSWIPVNCAGDSYACYMPTIPSGTAARHTRILGENYASCHADSAKTLLNVSYAAGTAINVLDSQYVDVACFEISDKATCGGGNFVNHPCGGTGQENFGQNGIFQSALSSNDTYTDLFIHGLVSEGIHGATGVGIVIDHVHIRGVPEAGIDMDDDPWFSGNISVAGGLTMTNSITEWVGCVEEYPVVHTYPYVECRDQNAGGYADGFGTASTTGDWYFDHDTWQYNFQDGLDLLHSGMQNLTVTNSLSLGNDGQAFKIGAADSVVFQNNIAMVNCNRITSVIGDEPSSAIVSGVTPCRAGGDWTVFSFTDLGSYKVQNNTFIGYAATPFDFGCEGGWEYCQNASSVFQNNVVLGYSDPNYNGGTGPGLFYGESANMPANQGWAIRDHNLFYGVRSGYCPTPLQTGEVCTSDPMFVSEPASPISAESDLDGFNFTPASGSPLIGGGVAIPGITTDQNGTTRPNPPAIGAIQ